MNLFSFSAMAVTAALLESPPPALRAAAGTPPAESGARVGAPRGTDGAKPDVLLDWNVTTLRTTAAAAFNPPLESRNVAIVHIAMFDAVNAIAGEFQPYAAGLRPPEGASAEAAAAAAAHFTLVRLYPVQKAALDVAYAASLAAIPEGPARTDGIAIGEEAASRILALRATDGAEPAMAAPYTPGRQPGDWNPTPPDFLNGLDPGWGSVKPFCLSTGSQFRPGPPPAPDGHRYALDFKEIHDVGSIASPSRTRAQTDLARFWVATGSQNWNPAARQVVSVRGRTLSQAARALALLNMAGADAFIACWDAKFAYGQWRPVTAIRAADTDGNPETSADPSWTPLLVTPPFPDYPAGHTAYAAAAEQVLAHVFGAEPGTVMMLTSPSAPGVVETYRTFAGLTDGVVDARVWGGIHWRTSSVRGRELGDRVGRWAVENCLKAIVRARENR